MAPGTMNGPWSVRAHLTAIAIVIVVMLVGVGALLGRETWQNSKADGRADAASRAAIVAGAMERSHLVARDQVIALAANPAVVPLLADSSDCALEFNLEPFPGAHLDVVRSGGEVACSSAQLPAEGATHAGAGWLDVASTEPGVVSDVFNDEVSGLPAVAVSAPMNDEGRVVGVVAIVMPTGEIARAITDIFGSAPHYQFAVASEPAGMWLSWSPDLDGGSVPTSLTGTDPLAGHLTGSHPVDGMGWVVVAGADAGTVLASTRSVLIRGGLLGGLVLLVLVGSILIVNRRIARPLRALTRAVGSDGGRHTTALASVGGPTEVRKLAAEFQAAIAARDDYEIQLAHQAFHDPLTGLANRALLVERLNDAVVREGRNRAPVAVLFIDLDRFKQINDSLGHDVGDTVLVEVARRVVRIIPSTATLARFGGDEFVVIVEGCDERLLEQLVDDLLAGIVAPIETNAAVVRVTGSIGIAISAHGRGAVDLIRDADEAMYAAKEAGRDRAQRFTSGLHDRVTERLALATEFRVALERNELHLVYQPKIDLPSGDIIGVEALLRWDHPALGSVPPATFIPIAEESDVIVRVGEYVLEEACRQTVMWQEAGIDLHVAVNISGRQLVDGGLPLQVATALALTGLPAESLYLELTETLIMTDTLATRRSIDELHALGVRLSIDDFGTGYSSLSYLHRFPVDELKIDRSFVHDLTSSAHRAPVVSAMIAMGSALGLEIVAEGVETREQAAQLRALGCHKAQGYHFSQPVVAAAIAPLVRRLLTVSTPHSPDPSQAR